MEHCILHPDKNNIQNCVLAPWIDGSLYPEYMVISFDEYADQKDLFSFINKEITQEVVDYEYKIFEEEFGNSNYYKRVHEKFLKKIYSPQWTRKPSLYTLEEVQSYHKQYIKNGEYIITHHNKIISHNIKSVSPLSLAENLVPKIDYHLIYLE
mgnify:CR=1 FL=1